jgi:hypothetical protein
MDHGRLLFADGVIGAIALMVFRRAADVAVGIEYPVGWGVILSAEVIGTRVLCQPDFSEFSVYDLVESCRDMLTVFLGNERKDVRGNVLCVLVFLIL